jgi:hypothetical protein
LIANGYGFGFPDHNPSVCAAIVQLLAARKAPPVKRFGKLLTL